MGARVPYSASLIQLSIRTGNVLQARICDAPRTSMRTVRRNKRRLRPNIMKTSRLVRRVEVGVGRALTECQRTRRCACRDCAPSDRPPTERSHQSRVGAKDPSRPRGVPWGLGALRRCAGGSRTPAGAGSCPTRACRVWQGRLGLDAGLLHLARGLLALLALQLPLCNPEPPPSHKRRSMSTRRPAAFPSLTLHPTYGQLLIRVVGRRDVVTLAAV